MDETILLPSMDCPQTPKRYGCGSWRHVIHESQQFEIRKQSQADNGATVVWYRSRPRETSKEQE
ncbi:hypothetical protein GDH07_00035 [Pseudomonas sp. MC042]|uniref:Uncharacterized protein n=1 Tax=Pseudomonas piscis TaxID=2614538 RepID=A0A7X1PGD4_9PSED|nr:hypothetical protein [Pseudomonas piscis]MQA51701.1 hypothetical protein [Pseudomonas piscis]